MVKLSNKAKSVFDRVFPERQIYHRSGGTVQYISISPWQQAMLAAGAVAALGWTGFATVNYVASSGASPLKTADARELEKYERWVQDLRAKDALSRSLLEERTDAFQRATVEFEDRHQELKQLLEALDSGDGMDVSTLRGNGSDLLVEASIEDADARQSRDRAIIAATLQDAGPSGRLFSLTRDQEALLDKAEDVAVDRAERARGVLRLTAVGEDRISDTVDLAMGGPLVEIAALTSSSTASPSDLRFEGRLSQVRARMLEAQHLENTVASLPLADPIGVPARLTSNYGLRVDPFTKRPGWHNGIDMAAYYKAPIVAAGPGTVVYAGRKSGYGRVVDVEHGSGFKSRYAHLHSINVKKGDTVEIGDTLGLMGSSGRSTGPHLHYEIWFNGKPYDPSNFLKAGKHVHEE
ncbi:MAG: M23 family metallopeptidase [Pseudomonadota bacterium]